MHGIEEMKDSAVDGMVESRPKWLINYRDCNTWPINDWHGGRKAGGSLESIGDYKLPDMSVKAYVTPPPPPLSPLEDSGDSTSATDDNNNDKKGDGWEFQSPPVNTLLRLAS